LVTVNGKLLKFRADRNNYPLLLPGADGRTNAVRHLAALLDLSQKLPVKSDTDNN
jgi:hypothetical protein